MCGLHKSCQLGCRNQSDVARPSSPNDYGFLLIDHPVEHSSQVLAKTRICRFTRHEIPNPLYSSPVRPGPCSTEGSKHCISRPGSRCRLLGSNPVECSNTFSPPDKCKRPHGVRRCHPEHRIGDCQWHGRVNRITPITLQSAQNDVKINLFSDLNIF